MGFSILLAFRGKYYYIYTENYYIYFDYICFQFYRVFFKALREQMYSWISLLYPQIWNFIVTAWIQQICIECLPGIVHGIGYLMVKSQSLYSYKASIIGRDQPQYIQ